VLQLLLAVGTALMTFDIWFSGEGHGSPAADNEMLYVWIALYGAYFFSRIETVLQIAFIALSYAIVLGLAAPASIFVTRWLETVGTLAVAAVLVHQLKDRLADLVSRLADAARTDPLTGLHNRRGFEELIAAETERARRYESPLTILVGDLDHFESPQRPLRTPGGRRRPRADRPAPGRRQAPDRHRRPDGRGGVRADLSRDRLRHQLRDLQRPDRRAPRRER